MSETSAAPEVLRAYTVAMKPLVAEARGTLSNYRLAVAAFNTADKEEVVHEIPARAGSMAATLDWLDAVDEAPALFAEALEAVDRAAFAPGVIGDALHQGAVASAFLSLVAEHDPDLLDADGLEALVAGQGLQTGRALAAWAEQPAGERTSAASVEELEQLLSVVEDHSDAAAFRRGLLEAVDGETLAGLVAAERVVGDRVEHAGTMDALIGGALAQGELSEGHQQALLEHRNTDMVAELVTSHEGWAPGPLGALGVAVLTEGRWLPQSPAPGPSWRAGGERQSAVLEVVASSAAASQAVLADPDARQALVTTDYRDEGVAAGGVLLTGLTAEDTGFDLAHDVYTTIATEGISNDGLRVAAARSMAVHADDIAMRQTQQPASDRHVAALTEILNSPAAQRELATVTGALIERNNHAYWGGGDHQDAPRVVHDWLEAVESATVNVRHSDEVRSQMLSDVTYTVVKAPLREFPGASTVLDVVRILGSEGGEAPVAEVSRAEVSRRGAALTGAITSLATDHRDLLDREVDRLVAEYESRGGDHGRVDELHDAIDQLDTLVGGRPDGQPPTDAYVAAAHDVYRGLGAITPSNTSGDAFMSDLEEMYGR